MSIEIARSIGGMPIYRGTGAAVTPLSCCKDGAPGTIRTCDRLVRSQLRNTPTFLTISCPYIPASPYRSTCASKVQPLILLEFFTLNRGKSETKSPLDPYHVKVSPAHHHHIDLKRKRHFLHGSSSTSLFNAIPLRRPCLPHLKRIA